MFDSAKALAVRATSAFVLLYLLGAAWALDSWNPRGLLKQLAWEASVVAMTSFLITYFAVGPAVARARETREIDLRQLLVVLGGLGTIATVTFLLIR